MRSVLTPYQSHLVCALSDPIGLRLRVQEIATFLEWRCLCYSMAMCRKAMLAEQSILLCVWAVVVARQKVHLRVQPPTVGCPAGALDHGLP